MKQALQILESLRTLLPYFLCYTLISTFILIHNYKTSEAGEAEEIKFPPIKSESENIKNITKNQNINAPKAEFENADFIFKPVEDGTKVTHDFIVHNTGNQTLLIKKVKTDCGCTTVAYDSAVLPSQKGIIRINVDTTDYSNKFISRFITVTTNDPQAPTKKLKISGSVETLVNIFPKRVMLLGNVSQDIEMVVKIAPIAKYPFIIKSVKINDGTNINVNLKESNLPIGSWDIIVKNTRQKDGRYFDKILLNTDSNIIPEITINVYGNITD
ncbi:MAG: DUF1573 domain-containing protein [Desulfamplus sp.]|nr:DUF1573 domain-containing protein [Desulfamplus sp.]